MESHPESSIFPKNQQFEPPQPVAQAWTPIHTPEDRTRFEHTIQLADWTLLAVAQAQEKYGTR
jgi:hypothetical protein